MGKRTIAIFTLLALLLSFSSATTGSSTSFAYRMSFSGTVYASFHFASNTTSILSPAESVSVNTTSYSSVFYLVAETNNDHLKDVSVKLSPFSHETDSNAPQGPGYSVAVRNIAYNGYSIVLDTTDTKKADYTVSLANESNPYSYYDSSNDDLYVFRFDLYVNSDDVLALPGGSTYVANVTVTGSGT